jgi:DDE superfamily endonuclease
MKLNSAERHIIVFEYEKCGSIRGVVKKLGYHRKTVQRWVRKSQVGDALVARAGGGRKKALNAIGAKKAVDMLLSGEYSSAKQVAEVLHAQGLTTTTTPPHPTTIIRHAKRAAMQQGKPIRAVTGKPSKLLTANTIEKRLDFCNANATRNWSNVMITDRKKFYFRYPGTCFHRCQWVEKGKTRVAYCPSKPSGLNIYMGITRWGVTKAHIVSGTTGETSSFKNQKGQVARNITISEYKEVLGKTLIPEGRRLFSSAGISTWILQQDNDPTHKKASQMAVAMWNQKNPSAIVQVLPNWPPNSPDLSPIENLWAWAQAKVDAVGCQSFKEFKACVLKTLNEVPPSYLNNLFKSMKERVKSCIEANGGKTKY